MPRLRVIHWKPAEAEPLLKACRATGHIVEFDAMEDGAAIARAVKANPPEAVVIDVTRRPSHGREFARWLGERKSTRSIPVIFLDSEAVEMSPSKLNNVILTAIRKWTPPEREEHRSTKTTAEKLGVKSGATIAVIDAPRDYASIIGLLPADASIAESQPGDVTVWFVNDEHSLFAGLSKIRPLASGTKLWIAWRKGSKTGFKENTIRNAALDSGLVDYKICSLDAHWSAIAFAVRKGE